MSTPIITIAGNTTADVDLRWNPNGVAVARFTVAASERKRQDDGTWVDGDTVFMTCTAWRQMAEAVAESLVKGTRVIVTGRLKQRSYEAKDGTKRTVYEVEADEVAPSLKFATCKVARAERSRPAAGNGGQGDADPWASGTPGGYSEEAPF
jgi:single-strand DNA-binding protein